MRRVRRRIQTRPRTSSHLTVGTPTTPNYPHVSVKLSIVLTEIKRAKSTVENESTLDAEERRAGASGQLTKTTIMSHSSNKKSTKERGQIFQVSVFCLLSGSLGPSTLSTQQEASSVIFT